MKYFNISIGIFITLAASRFVPHPPNFTSLIALSFYVPVLFGLRFIPVLMFCFIVTDFIIVFHSVTFFTWGIIFLIGMVSKYFLKNIVTRFLGALIGSVIFFIFTNFGVWLLDGYEMSINGLILCFVMAIPFFTYNLISTLFFSFLIECLYSLFNRKFAVK